MISWIAKKQYVVARSSTEVEYQSMAYTVAELYWLRMLFKELHISLPVAPCIWVDNISSLTLSLNPVVFHARANRDGLPFYT